MTRGINGWSYGLVGLAVGLLLVWVPFGHGQESQETAESHAAVAYGLTARSTFQQGCFPPCRCLLEAETPLRGTFTLTPRRTDAEGFRHYAVTDVRWVVLDDEHNVRLKIAGSGSYRVNPATATGVQQMKLTLEVGDEGTLEFDSGLVPGGYLFPTIDIVLTENGFVCFDRVLHVVATPREQLPMPRHAGFVLHPRKSSVGLELLRGSARGRLAGGLRLFLGDPDVPVIALAGMTGVSVEAAHLVALELEPQVPGVPDPLVFELDRRRRSIGAYNVLTGEIRFSLYLRNANTGSLVPMPVDLAGRLGNAGLEVAGDNGNVADAKLSMKITAFEAPLPPLPRDVWFSTENGFGAAMLSPRPERITPISDGDLLSRRGHVVRWNRELTGRLGIMPVVPDLGVDAVTLARHGEVWFSFEHEAGPQWSESLGVLLKPGDLLSERGYVVRTNEQLLERFGRMPTVADAGLDAVTRTPFRALWFSTERDFFSEALGQRVGHGDLLSSRGRIVRTNAELLKNFGMVDLTLGPVPPDYGLDAVVLRPRGEIWFSTEVGFYVRDPIDPDRRYWVSDGDLLSTRGYVVAGNLDLVALFEPVEDVDSFGLDAVERVRPIRVADFDMDDDVDEADVSRFGAAVSGPAVLTADLEGGDLDGDGDCDLVDAAWLQLGASVEGCVGAADGL